jgi:hypothetical protein
MSLPITTPSGIAEPVPTAPARWREIIAIVVAGLVFFGLNVDFTLYGDAAMYADFVVLRKFDELTLHIGYYAVLYVADLVARDLAGVPIHETMVWLNVFAGAATLAIAYLLALELLNGRREALLTTALLAVSGRFISNSTESEMYMVQTFCVLTSFLLYSREQPWSAGVFAAFGLLVSPLSAFAYLFFPALDVVTAGRIRLALFLRAVAAGTVIYLPYLVIDGHELFYGIRGLLVVSKLAHLDPRATLFNFPKYQFEAYSTLLLLVFPALLAFRQRRAFIIVALAVAIPHLYIILKLTGEDNVFILNTDFFFVGALVCGWSELVRRFRSVLLASVPIAGHLVIYGAAGLLFTSDHHRTYQQELRSIADTYIKANPAVLITDWGTKQAFVFYGRDSAATVVADEKLAEQVYDIQNAKDMRKGSLAVDQLYLLDTWHASALSRLLRSNAGLRAREDEYSTLAQSRRMLGIDCKILARGYGRLYRCQQRSGS